MAVDGTGRAPGYWEAYSAAWAKPKTSAAQRFAIAYDPSKPYGTDPFLGPKNPYGAAPAVDYPSAPSGGSGRRSGGGGGGGAVRWQGKNISLQRYTPGAFNDAQYRQQAQARVDAQIAESIRQNTAQRAQAALERDRMLQEVALEQSRGEGTLRGENDMNTARLNNTMQNTGFSGGSAYNNQTMQNNAFQSALGNLIAGYDTQRRQTGNTYLDRLYELDEADRTIQNQRPGLVEELYGQLLDSGYNRYTQGEQLKLSAVNQANDARLAELKYLYGI